MQQRLRVDGDIFEDAPRAMGVFRDFHEHSQNISFLKSPR